MTMDIKESAEIPFAEGPPSREWLSLVAICLDAESGAALRQFVEGTPFLRLQAEVHSYLAEEDASLTWTQPPGPDICLIDFDRDRAKASITAERIHERLPGTALFAISSQSQPDLIIEGMRCGCSEYLIKPVGGEQLWKAVARVGVRKRERRAPISGQVLTFLGAKGGAGATTITTHLAALLAKCCSRKTLLIDLHPGCGEAALFLGLTEHQYHFYELVENVDRLDSELLQSFVLHHSSGLDLLPAPEIKDRVRDVLPEAVGQAVAFLRTKYEFVLIDCSPGLTNQNLAVITHSDHVYIITVAEVAALRNVARLLDYFTRREFGQDKVDVIVNRHNAKNNVITDAQIEKAIRKKIFLKVPNHYQQVIQTINAGDPSAQLSTSAVARSLLSWAEALGGKPEAQAEKKKWGRYFLGLFGDKG